jgi:putative chitinase
MNFSDSLKALWPNGDQHIPGLVEGITAMAPEVFAKYGFSNNLIICHAFAQFSEENGAGLEMVENLNYSEQGLLNTFPSHFTGDMAARYAHNPRMIADVAYGGRMGNAPPPSDDGWNRRGRGLSQVTGNDGYAALQKELTDEGYDLDIMSDPDLICDPRFTLVCGVVDFILCGCLPFAIADDVVGVTKKLNGGTNGLSDRIAWLKRWKATLTE